jgi:hypothetical protein
MRCDRQADERWSVPSCRAGPSPPVWHLGALLGAGGIAPLLIVALVELKESGGVADARSYGVWREPSVRAGCRASRATFRRSTKTLRPMRRDVAFVDPGLAQSIGVASFTP